MENPPHEFAGLLVFFYGCCCCCCIFVVFDFAFFIIINFYSLIFCNINVFILIFLGRTEKEETGKGNFQRFLSGLLTTTGAD